MDIVKESNSVRKERDNRTRLLNESQKLVDDLENYFDRLREENQRTGFRNDYLDALFAISLAGIGAPDFCDDNYYDD